MGRIKFLRMQMIPWCFQYCIMGNGISSSGVQFQRPNPPPVRNIKLINLDGEVKIYDRPIQALELMLEHPKHMVCRSDSFYIGQKIPPLSEQEQLQLGHNYFLLPIHFFQSVLSFVTIASFASSPSSPSSQLGPRLQSQSPAAAGSATNSLICSRARDNDLKRAAFLKNAAASSCPPFDLQKTTSGSLRIRVSEEFISHLMTRQGKQLIKDEDVEEHGSIRLLCTTPQLQKDYRQLVINGSHRQWKPKLEMIKETPHAKRKVLSSFGMKKRHTTNKKKPHQSSTSSLAGGTHPNQKKTQKRAAADQLQTHHLSLSKHKIRGFTASKSR